MDKTSVLTALKSRSDAKRKIEAVEIEGETFYVRTLSGAERDGYDYETHVLLQKNLPVVQNFKGRLLCRAICDEQGNRLFTDSDAETLGGFDPSIVNALYVAASRLAKLDGTAIEDAEKN